MIDEYYININNEKDEETKDKSKVKGYTIKNAEYAQAYVPMQRYETPLKPETSLKVGTSFSKLNMPYKKGSNLKEGY